MSSSGPPHDNPAYCPDLVTIVPVPEQPPYQHNDAPLNVSDSQLPQALFMGALAYMKPSSYPTQLEYGFSPSQYPPGPYPLHLHGYPDFHAPTHQPPMYQPRHPQYHPPYGSHPPNMATGIPPFVMPPPPPVPMAHGGPRPGEGPRPRGRPPGGGGRSGRAPGGRPPALAATGPSKRDVAAFSQMITTQACPREFMLPSKLVDNAISTVREAGT